MDGLDEEQSYRGRGGGERVDENGGRRRRRRRERAAVKLSVGARTETKEQSGVSHPFSLCGRPRSTRFHFYLKKKNATPVRERDKFKNSIG